MLSFDEIKELINIIDSSSLRSFELEEGNFKFKLSKNEENIKENKTCENNNIEKSVIVEEKAIREEIKVKKSEVKEVVEDYNIIKSPLVGTYYSSNEPGGKPYIKVGDKVKKGDVLCIIEAMKIMNEIVSEYDGEIVEVLRSDEDIVEFGMELFKIK